MRARHGREAGRRDTCPAPSPPSSATQQHRPCAAWDGLLERHCTHCCSTDGSRFRASGAPPANGSELCNEVRQIVATLYAFRWLVLALVMQCSRQLCWHKPLGFVVDCESQCKCGLVFLVSNRGLKLGAASHPVHWVQGLARSDSDRTLNMRRLDKCGRPRLPLQALQSSSKAP